MKADGSFPHYDYQYIRTCTTFLDLLRIRFPTLVHNPPSVLNKSVVTQLLKKFYAFYGNQSFTAVYTKAHRYWPSLSK